MTLNPIFQNLRNENIPILQTRIPVKIEQEATCKGSNTFYYKIIPGQNKMYSKLLPQISIRQQPLNGRTAGFQDLKAKRKLETPLIVEVIFANENPTQGKLLEISSKLVCFVTLITADSNNLRDATSKELRDATSLIPKEDSQSSSDGGGEPDETCLENLCGTTWSIASFFTTRRIRIMLKNSFLFLEI